MLLCQKTEPPTVRDREKQGDTERRSTCTEGLNERETKTKTKRETKTDRDAERDRDGGRNLDGERG